jgi:hypothetical protein
MSCSGPHAVQYNIPTIYWFTHSWSWALLEEPPIVQLFKNFSAFYGTRRFITVLTRALHLSLSRARWFQSTPPHNYLLITNFSTASLLMFGLRNVLSMSVHFEYYIQFYIYAHYLLHSLLKPWRFPSSYFRIKIATFAVISNINSDKLNEGSKYSMSLLIY